MSHYFLSACSQIKVSEKILKAGVFKLEQIKVAEVTRDIASRLARLAYAIPDHPWIDSADGAAVRIAMTVAAPGKAEGILEKVITEQAREDGENEVTLIRSGALLPPIFKSARTSFRQTHSNLIQTSHRWVRFARAQTC